MKTAKGSLILFLCFVFLFAIPVCAAESVTFTMDSVNCSVNRLFDMGVYAQGSPKISAALFEFRFDQSLMEFREVSAPDSATVVSHTEGNCVRVSFLCEQGVDVSANPALFALRFKSLVAGSTSVEYTVKECVDADAQFVTVGNCTTGRINIEEAATTAAKANKKQSTKAAESIPKRDQKTTPKASTSPTDEALRDLGTINSVVQQESDKTTPVIVLCTSVIAAVLFIVYFIYRIKADKKKK